MDCERIERLLPGAAAESLEPAEARDVAGHVADCARCRARDEAMRGALGRFEALPRATPPEEMWERIEQAVAREMATPPVRRHASWIAPAWGLAAAAAILAILVVQPWAQSGIKVLDVKGMKLDSVKIGDAIETPVGATVEIELPGAPRVRISERSRVEIVSGKAVRLISGQIELGGTADIHGAVGSLSASRAKVVISSDGYETDIRLQEGELTCEGTTLRAGTWLGGSRGSMAQAPLAEYDKFLVKRREAGDAGRRLAKALMDDDDTGENSARKTCRAIAEDGPRVVSRILSDALGLDAAKSASVRASLEEAERLKLPPQWIVTDNEDLDRHEATAKRVKKALVARLALAKEQRKLLQEMIEDDEDDEDDE